jgi:hypothetical protein
MCRCLSTILPSHHARPGSVLQAVEPLEGCPEAVTAIGALAIRKVDTGESGSIDTCCCSRDVLEALPGNALRRPCTIVRPLSKRCSICIHQIFALGHGNCDNASARNRLSSGWGSSSLVRNLRDSSARQSKAQHSGNFVCRCTAAYSRRVLVHEKAFHRDVNIPLYGSMRDRCVGLCVYLCNNKEEAGSVCLNCFVGYAHSSPPSVKNSHTQPIHTCGR